MKLIEAQTRIEKLAYIPFKKYLSPDQVQDAMMKINKGKTGQLLELTIGLNLSNTTLDIKNSSVYYMFLSVRMEILQTGCT